MNLPITMDESIPQQAGPGAGAETLQQAISALETARTGLQWYRGLMPEYVDGSDAEADDEIAAALASLEAALAAQPEQQQGQGLVHPAMSTSGRTSVEGGVCSVAALSADGLDDLERQFTAKDSRYPARKAASEALYAYIDEWIEGYELDDGEHRPHAPSEFEQFLIMDAFHGLTGDDEYQRLDAAWRVLCGPLPTVTKEQALHAVDRLRGAEPRQHLDTLRAFIEQSASGSPARTVDGQMNQKESHE